MAEDTLSSSREPLLEKLRSLGPVKLVLFLGLALALMIFIFLVSTRVGTVDMQPLYNDLDPVDANEIVARLEVANIPYRLEKEGKSLLVASGETGRVRILLAEAGLPRGGSSGYELFDKDEGLGTSSFKQNITKIRALEGELAKTIMSIAGIRNARVHLVLPERQLFSEEKQAPSASVFLRLSSSTTLAKSQVMAIQYLVASAVPELKTNAVSIIDNNGNLIAHAQENQEGAGDAGTNEDTRSAYQTRLSSELKTLLESTLGVGKIRLQANVDMDFDQVSTNTETFDPEKSAVRSSQTVTEDNQTTNPTKTVSVENNLPENQGKQSESAAQDLSRRSEETLNYEISRQVTNQVRQSGVVRKLSVAVVVDGIYETNDKGERTYKPRTPEELEKIATIVKSAVGYDEERGDKVEVINMQFISFTDDGLTDEVTLLDQIDVNNYVKIIETLVLSFIGLLVIFLVIRPLMQKVLESVPEITGGETSDQLLAAAGITPALEGPSGKAIAGSRQDNADPSDMINIDSIKGQIRTSSIKRVGEIIEQHPEEALNIIRGWMYEGQ
ncbi:MAG: flagellar basal-body MS-ring/collar protein FliF [bacterium]